MDSDATSIIVEIVVALIWGVFVLAVLTNRKKPPPEPPDVKKPGDASFAKNDDLKHLGVYDEQ
jgi:hypothetical protein